MGYSALSNLLHQSPCSEGSGWRRMGAGVNWTLRVPKTYVALSVHMRVFGFLFKRDVMGAATELKLLIKCQ